MKLLLMADRHVGLEITRWLLIQFPEDIALVVATAENEVWATAHDIGVSCTIFESAKQISDLIDKTVFKLDIGVLAWWPKLIKRPLLNKPRQGFVNTHPSMLPHNRGKHPNFWALVEQAPFGVTLHKVNDGVDSGEIIAQKAISYDWEDNGHSLYLKAQEEMVKLFQQTYPSIRSLNFPRQQQDLIRGSFHRSQELEEASIISLDQYYRARDLLNLLRARTFPGYPSCWFQDGDDRFEVRVEIKRKQS